MPHICLPSAQGRARPERGWVFFFFQVRFDKTTLSVVVLLSKLFILSSSWSSVCSMVLKRNEK